MDLTPRLGGQEYIERLACAQRRLLQLRLHVGGQMGSGELGPGLLGRTARAPVSVGERAERLPCALLERLVVIESEHPRVAVAGRAVVGMRHAAEAFTEGGRHGHATTVRRAAP